MRAFTIIGLVFLFFGVATRNVAAVDIPVTNPSFEIGADTGGTGEDWHAFPNPAVYSPSSTWVEASGSYASPYVENRVGDHFPTTPDGGSYSLLLSNSGTISQTLSTLVYPGDVVTLSFFTGFDGTSANPVLPAGSVTAEISGVATGSTLIDESTFTSQTWHLESVTATATSRGFITISFVPTTGNPWLDGVSVSATPEPASLGLLGIGGLVLIARRRRA